MDLANRPGSSTEKIHYSYDPSSCSLYEINYTDANVAKSVRIFQASTETDVACRSKPNIHTDLDSKSRIIDLTWEEANAEPLEKSVRPQKDTASSDTVAKSVEEDLSSNSEARQSLAVATYLGSGDSQQLPFITNLHPETSWQKYRMNDLGDVRNGGGISHADSVQLGGVLHRADISNSLPSHSGALASNGVVTLLKTDCLHPMNALRRQLSLEKLRDAILLVLGSETSKRGCSLSGPTNTSAHTSSTAVPSLVSLGSAISCSDGWGIDSNQPPAEMSLVEFPQSPSPAITNRRAVSSSKSSPMPNLAHTHEIPSELASAQRPQKRRRGRPKKGQEPPPTVWCKGCGHPGGGPRSLTSHRNRLNADEWCRKQIPSPARQAQLAAEAAEKSDERASTSK